MSANKHKPHLIVIPEDEHDAEICRGFHDELLGIRQFQVEPPAGGWLQASASGTNVARTIGLSGNANCHLLIVVDFDNQNPTSRLEEIKTEFSVAAKERLFVLGLRDEPSNMQERFGCSRFQLGQKLAEACRNDDQTLWEHEQLAHNAEELGRLRSAVRPFLFPA
jgi:hypothetical protein